ncbi:MAG: ATP-binding protein [Pseudomonadota bacterium]
MNRPKLTMRVSIKSRITGLVVLLFLVGLVTLTLAITTQIERDMTALLSAQQFSIASYIAGDIDGKIRHRITVLNLNADNITPEFFTDSERARGYLDTRAPLLLLFGAGVVLVSRDGVGIADYPPAPGRVGGSFSELEYFREVMATGNPAIGQPRIGRFTKKPGVAIAVPVKNPAGGILGVLVGFATLSDTTLFGQLENTNIGYSGYAAINAPKFGLIVTSSDRSRILTDMAKPGVNVMLDRFVAGFEGSGVAINSRGIETLTSAKQIPSTGWVAQIVLPTSEAFAPIQAMKQTAYVMSGLLAVLVSGLIWWAVRHVLRPLDTAAATINAMVTGSPQALKTLQVSSSDEISHLLTSFNALLQQRGQAQDQLNAERNLVQTTLDALLEHVCVIDEAGVILATNRSWRNFALGNGGDLCKLDVGVNYLAACDYAQGTCSEEARPMAQGIRAVLRGETARFNMEYPCDSPTERRWFSAQVLRAESMTGVKAVIAHFDISERKRAEEKVHKATAVAMDWGLKAEAANRAKSEFLANMSHEIRTPMNAILGLSEVLVRTDLTMDQQDCVDKILTSGRSLLGILNDILDYSKVEAGRLELEQANFSLERLLKDLATLVSANAQAKSLELLIGTAPNVPLTLVGDGLRLLQILTNLTANAVKFTETGQVVVGVTLAEQCEEHQVLLRFEIRDTGIGIAEEALSRLFSPFSQADNSTTRRFGGTGLGLAICRRLVELMRGEIGVDSRAGQGSTFWFTVPFAVGEAPATGLSSVTPSIRPSCALAGLSILVVEDNSINQDVARRLLVLEGAEVAVAENGLEAIHQLNKIPPAHFDLVLMDIQMPVMDGFEATRHIRANLGLTDLPIIALTAGVMASDRQEALAAGVNDFLPKPFEVDQLVSTVARCCGRPFPHPNPPPLGEGENDTSPQRGEVGRGAEGLLFDADTALKRAGGNRDLLASLLRRFREQFTPITGDLNRLLEAGDIQEMIRRFHTLRGVAGNLGMRSLAGLATRIEAALRLDSGGVFISGLDELPDLLRATLDAIQEAGMATPPTAETATPDSRSGFDLATLRQLLEKKDMVAIDAFAALHHDLASRMDAASFGHLAQAIDDLDFRAALRIFNQANPP